MYVLTILLTLACGVDKDPSQLGGQDLELDGDLGEAPEEKADAVPLEFSIDQGASSAPNSVLDGSAACLDDTGIFDDFVADGGRGVIDVSHYGVLGDCCADWEVSGEVKRNNVIAVTYTDVARARDKCNCTCSHVLVYEISNVDAGDWTVRADGSEDDATVR